MKIQELNHVAIHVKDVRTSSNFYRKALRLDAIPRPDFDFPGAWFRLGARQELHLIGTLPGPDARQNRQNHFALLTDDLDGWEAHFRENSIDYLPRKKRPDGAEQVFLSDPDGHFIELCSSPPD